MFVAGLTNKVSAGITSLKIEYDSYEPFEKFILAGVLVMTDGILMWILGTALHNEWLKVSGILRFNVWFYMFLLRLIWKNEVSHVVKPRLASLAHKLLRKGA